MPEKHSINQFPLKEKRSKMDKMRLSQIDDSNLTDQQIDSIVFSGITDDQSQTEYALVFGHSILLNQRVQTAVNNYKSGRIKKLILMGGNQWY